MVFKKQVLKIEGMHCSSCSISIDMDLEDIDGVKSAKTNYYKNVTEVEFDVDKLSIDKVIESIKNTGYIAIPIES